MKTSCLPYGLMLKRAREKGLAALVEWVEFCAEHGFDGVEVAENWLQELSREEVVAFIESVRSAPLEVSGLTVHNHMNCPTGRAREAARQRIGDLVSMARLLGAPSIRIESGAWGDYECYEMSRQQAIENTIETIQYCLPVAQQEGIVLAIENHPGWVSRFADALVELLERIPSRYLGLNLDTGSLYREGQRPRDFLESDMVCSRTISVHLKTIRFDPNPEIGRWDHLVPFKQSDIDYRYIFSRLRKHGFDGWVTYEADEGVGLQGIPEGVAFARRMWREVTSERESSTSAR